MNGRPITDEDIEFVKNNYLSMNDEEIAKHLNRSSCTIQNIRSKKNLLRCNPNIPFTTEQHEFIRANYHILTDKEIALKINRKASSINSYRQKYNLKRGNYRRKEYVSRTVEKMRELIKFCETSKSPYKIDLAKQKLRKLSGL